MAEQAGKAEQASAGISDNTFKVLTFAGPLFASSLAITYDVGFFTGIGSGFFSFFSLSEHLVFALQSLPVAFPPAIFLLVNFTSGWALKQSYRFDEVSAYWIFWRRYRHRKTEHRLADLFTAELYFWLWGRHSFRHLLSLWLTAGVVCLPLVIVLVWIGQYAIGFLIIVMACIMMLWPIRPIKHSLSNNRSGAVLWAVVLIVTSFVIGLQRANTVLTRKAASETITVESGSLPARLIRGGDKGVLFFSLDNKKVRFLRWDAIKQIETL